MRVGVGVGVGVGPCHAPLIPWSGALPPSLPHPIAIAIAIASTIAISTPLMIVLSPLQAPAPPSEESSSSSSAIAMAAYLGNKLLQMGTKIVGVGRNYAAHAKELGAAIPKEPLIFLKPTSSYVREGSFVEIPSSCTFLDHEVELGVVIGRKGRDIQESQAMAHISGYALALDMTARELQAIAKKQGLPWTLAKGYDTFTPIGNFIPKKQVPNHSDLELWLEVDGQLKQKGSTNDMIFSIPVLVSYISTIMTLNEGDIILTGTPSGVGPVKAGQRMKAGITGLSEMSFEVKARK
ncbi:hypothetical protein M758_7G187400 [Ceratodon purpureus]|nr:hypothetical protein M758_7G187400 [Ceratodon purpureus]